MTEVSKMTDQYLNGELAQLMGYPVLPSVDYLPQYCTDPAASLEVQATAIAKDRNGYIRNLMFVCWRGEKRDYANLDDEEWVKLSAIASLLTATPRQRAEAAYMTLKGE